MFPPSGLPIGLLHLSFNSRGNQSFRLFYTGPLSNFLIGNKIFQINKRLTTKSCFCRIFKAYLNISKQIKEFFMKQLFFVIAFAVSLTSAAVEQQCAKPSSNMYFGKGSQLVFKAMQAAGVKEKCDERICTITITDFESFE